MLPTAELAAILDSIGRPGSFATGGTIPLAMPALHVEDFGRVALPLLPDQAERLAALATRAPFGRGARTLVDTDVRRTWQLGPDKVRIEGAGWQRCLDEILRRIGMGLGIEQPIAAEFYKLLLYREGDFFVSHRDTEKAPRMFGTLVVVLPSLSTGGELVVRHLGEEVRFDLVPADPGEMGFAAFFADCPHEVRPVAAGDRLTLVYNLLRAGAGRPPGAPDHRREEDRAAALLEGWTRPGPGSAEDWPARIVYPLDHAYTAAEIGFESLKGADGGVAAVLAKAAARSGCELHLSQLLIEESGWAEHTGGWGEEDGFDVGEVLDRWARLTEWRRPDGAPTAWADIPVDEERELSPPGSIAELQPDDEEFSEATGNEGASFERTYRRAALVLWPTSRALAVLNQAGIGVTLPYLEDLIAKRERGASPPSRAETERRIRELARLMTEDWTPGEWRAGPLGQRSTGGVVLAALTRFDDPDLIEAFWARTVPGSRIGSDDAPALAAALALLPDRQATEALCRAVEAGSPQGLAALSALFRRVATDRPDVAAPVAAALLGLLPAQPNDPRLQDQWGRMVAFDRSFVPDLLSALARLDGGLADRAVGTLLAVPALYDVDDVLVPQLVDLWQDEPDLHGAPALGHLREACLAHLRERTATEPQPPRDAARDARLRCNCAHCVEVGAFLKDREERVLELKAAEGVRSHVQDVLKKAQADVRAETVRTGRPYRLRLNKTQASFEHDLQRFRRDLDRLARLGSPSG